MVSALLPILLMQIGPAPMNSPVTAVPPELQDRPARTAPMLDRAPSAPAITTCLETARTEPAKARTLAEEWVSRTQGEQRATGRHCLGVAAANAGDLQAAAEAFLAAREEARDARFKARMGALAGSALLSLEKPEEALTVLDAARNEAIGDDALVGTIELDRALAYIATGQGANVGPSLSEARRTIPNDPETWLLSATFSRMIGELGDAQQHIERAAQLNPRDPAIGLEAGIIAAMGGRDEAARKSFQSVIAAAPDSEEGKAAQEYLKQLGTG